MIPAWLYDTNIALAFVATFLLCFAIGADWNHLRPAWRPVLIAGAIEQAVLAYANLEADRSNVQPDLRLFLLALSLLGLVLTACFALIALRHDHRAQARL